MTFDHALAFLLFAVVAAVTPGPSNLILTSTGARVGVGRGLPCLCGVVAGMGVLMALVAAGLGDLMQASPLIVHALRWFGVGFLLWLAWKVATAHPGAATDGQAYVGFWQAAAFQWVNPKSWLVAVSAVGAFTDTASGTPFVRAIIFGLLFVLAAFPSCFVWLAFGAKVQRLLRTERASRLFNGAMAALLVASILPLVR